MYEALDYGCDETEERNLEPSLEQFIEKLTCSGQSDINSDGGGDDEGIERDAGDELTLNSVLVMCINHLEVPSKSLASKNNDLKVSISTAEKHYRAVCRAIVTEAKDLITFLDQIAKGSNQLRNISSDPLINAALDELCVNDWARLWMQLVKDLRNGVRLKKVDPMYRNEGKVCEYEMTPYEMLLDDIRSQRYTLKHVEQQNVISNQVKKDAHSLILEFIRSRPPLKSVNERVLPPTPTKTDCAHDRLMKSIKKEHKLRPTSSLIDRPRRQYASLCNIRESLMESSQGLARLDLNDYPDLGLTQLGYSRRNSTYETRNGRSSVNEQLTPSPASRRRKLIRADIDLDLVCYSDDEDDDSCVVTRRKSVIPTTRASEVNEKTADKCDRRRSCKFHHFVVFKFVNINSRFAVRNLFGFGQSFTWNFKSNS